MKKFSLALGIVALLSVAFLAAPAPVMADCGKMVIVYYVWPSPPPPPPPPQPQLICREWYVVQPTRPMRHFANPNADKVLQDADRQSDNVNFRNDVRGNNNQVTNNVIINRPDNILGGEEGFTPTGFIPTKPETVDRITQTDYEKWMTETTRTDTHETGTVMTSSAETGFAMGPDDAFKEPQQQAVLAWNGREEVLILSTNEKANMPKGAAMLSVLPLPGKPISVERANLKSFVTAKAIMQEKLEADDDGFSLGEVLKTKIGSHNIFVWEVESKDDFQGKVQSYISDTYGGKAAALISSNTLKVIDQYLKEGFRYFAFDLTIVENELSTKEAIAYRFESTYAYFPLRISQIGGAGSTLVDLVVLTTLGDKQLGFSQRSGVQGSYPGLATFFSKTPFTTKDLDDIDGSLSKLFGNQTVYGRLIMFRSEKIDGFKNDFEAVPLSR